MSDYNRFRTSRMGAVDNTINKLQNKSKSLEKDWDRLRIGVDSLEQQRLVLEEEKSLFNDAELKLAHDRGEFEDRVEREWFTPLSSEAAARSSRVRINVGGQLFETTVSILTRDRFSLLASICSANSSIKQDEDGAYFFDRDWWVFRYILSFLRDGKLPDKVELLQQIYDEAGFYRLGILRYAIATKLNLPELRQAKTNMNHVVGGNAANVSGHHQNRDNNKITIDHTLREPKPKSSYLASSPMNVIYPLPDPHGFTSGIF